MLIAACQFFLLTETQIFSVPPGRGFRPAPVRCPPQLIFIVFLFDITLEYVILNQHKQEENMANTLKPEQKTMAISMLCEGSSIRAVERMTGIHRDTIMRLGVRMGEGCKAIMDSKMRGLNCKQIEVDEIWG